MRIQLCTCACVLFVLAAAAPAAAQFNAPTPPAPGEDYRVEIGAMFWSPSPELAINTNDLGPIGNEVDFVQEFGIEDKRFTEFRFTLKPARKHKLRVQYVPISYEQDAVLERTVVFGGRTFTVGLPAAADVEWKFWRFGYEWDFFSATGGFLGIIAELKYNEVHAEIASPIGTEIGEANAPIPGFGLIARGYFTENLSVTGEFTGFKVIDSLTERFDGTFWDFDIGATYNLGRNLGVQGGYRSLDVDYAADEDVARLKMKGFYFGGLVRF